MRVLVAAVALCFAAGIPAFATQKTLPAKDCDAAFVRAWRNDRDAAMARMPKQACWMRAETGPYVCYQDGCARAHVYFSGE